MKMFKKLASAAVLVAAVGAAHAVPQTVGGVTWDPDASNDFSSFSLAIRQFLDTTTFEASGWGHITTMNSTSPSVFCSGCEVTFQFGGFTPIGGGSLPGGVGSSVSYAGGWVKVYVDYTPEVDPFNAASMSFANTGDGDLWLSLEGHEVSGASLVGTVTNSGLSGVGQLDVVGGLAAAYFDTNTKDDGADFAFTNSFSQQNQPNWTDASGTGNFTSDSIALVPEPSSVALLGLGLVGLASVRRKSKKSA